MPSEMPQDRESKPSISPRAKRILQWLLTLALFAVGIYWFPSIASVALVASALFACPLARVQEMISLRWLQDSLPGPATQLSQRTLRVTFASVLALLGFLSAPLPGQLSLESYIDLQSSSASVTRTVEYSRAPVSTADCITVSGEDVHLSVLDDIRASSVGTQYVTVELSESVFNKQEELEVVVKDTKPPQIELSESSVRVELGEEYDPGSNVASVADPVDGALQRVDEEPTAKGADVGLDTFYDQGWYTVDSVDTSEARHVAVHVRALDQHGNAASASFDVEVFDPLEGVTLKPKTSKLEYSNKSVDALGLVTCSDKSVKVSCDGKVDLSKIGSKTVTYTLSKGRHTRTCDVKFDVRDTKKPIVTLGSKDLEITEGESFSPYDNVTEVRDEVDGALARVDAEPSDNGSGWYTVKGNFDTSASGMYYFTVVACDRNGNRTEKEFSLRVKEAPAPQAGPGFNGDYETGGPAAAGTSYVLNTNTMKFHRPSCRDVKRIAVHNRKDVVMTREEVTSLGYQPCKHCNP